MNKIALLTVAAYIGSASVVHAQLTGPELDRMAAERNAEMRPIAPLPRPPHAVSHEDIRPADRLWVCMSTDPYQPVYAAPSLSAPVIGQTMSDVAVAGGWVNGFATILRGGGRLGYIPTSSVRPDHSAVNPNGTCRIAGVRPDGSPVFSNR